MIHVAIPALSWQSVDARALVVLGALLAGWTVYLLASRLDVSLAPAPGRTLADYLSKPESGREYRIRIDKDAVILAALKLPGDPSTLKYIRYGSAAVAAFLGFLFRYPAVLSLGFGGLVYVVVNSYLEGKWRKFRVELERELPTFVGRLAGTLQTTASPSKALEEVLLTLAPDSPVRLWFEQVRKGMKLEGVRFLEEARVEAARISPSLALVVFLLRRMSETGGGGFMQAFVATAEEMSVILESRAVAGAYAERARGSVHMLLEILGLMLLIMLSKGRIRQSFAIPMVQMVSLLAIGAMAFGYFYMDRMISSTLE